jgi:hypothetical protein
LSVLKLWLATSTSIVLSSHALMHSCHAKIVNHGDSTLLVLLINSVPLHSHSAGRSTSNYGSTKFSVKVQPDDA